MRRRRLLQVALALPTLAATGATQTAPDSRYLPLPFDGTTVPSLARSLAEQPHRPRRDALPPFLARLD